MPPASKDNATCAKFIVHCSGPCSDVNIFLDASSGDPDLYALDKSWPIISSPPDCDNCKSFCESILGGSDHSAGQTDECTHLNTTEDQIYVLVYAYSDYGEAWITFENVTNVEELRDCVVGMCTVVINAFINSQE